ncbi:hypothetical protein [Qipengyuania gelatinilytica]|uniref:Uncharacterized protein n=1 Tax=Qipengyuania gelatinilytica TaxID=2867231 RepID=A0ABX9AAK3_9SPHN|nr:hypothetical protein [Qipengyuania gelatinilytica]QZD96228.1 hypothetical protein K3136_05930 [Qipengyuania gelatinilytica]
MNSGEILVERLRNSVKPEIGFHDALKVVLERAETDPAIKEMVLAKLGAKSSLNAILDPFPDHPQRFEVSIWDNQYGREVSKVEARYCIAVTAFENRKTVFEGKADLRDIETVIKKAKRWKMTELEKASLAKIASDYPDSLVGRMIIHKRGTGGRHVHEDHFVVCRDPVTAGDVRLVIPKREIEIGGFVTTLPDGSAFATKSNAKGKSRILFQSRLNKRSECNWSSW